MNNCITIERNIQKLFSYWEYITYGHVVASVRIFLPTIVISEEKMYWPIIITVRYQHSLGFAMNEYRNLSNNEQRVLFVSFFYLLKYINITISIVQISNV